MDCGYARVSTGGQSLDSQMDALAAFGCERIWSEKVGGASGKQEELASLIDYLRPGDRFVVTKLDRAGRTVRGLIDTVQEIEGKGCAFVSLGDSIDTSTPHGRLFFTMIAAMAEFERAVIVERTNEGLAAARSRGRVGGRPAADPEKLELAFRMYDAGTFSVAEVCEQSGVSRSTLFKYLQMRREKQS